MLKHEFQIVLTTCSDNAKAKTIAETLVREDLAGCVNIVPGVRSIYRWRDQIEDDQENLLVIKSMKSRYPAIERRVRELHPYELPEIVAVPIGDGLQDYLAWLAQPESL